VNIEAVGQAAIGVYEGVGGYMLKENYKAHVAMNRFDLDTLPACGAKTPSGGLCKHKGIFVMAVASATVGLLQGRSTKPLERVTTAIFMALGVKKLS
tara:strand:- start:10072 stop:10362 length:291 start_codon:yes stop_codon:yes gene_type:complete